MWPPLLLSAACIPALILFAAIHIDRRRRKQRGERQPLSEKLLRPAGYTLQCKLEDLNDALMIWLMGTVIFSLGALGAFASTPRDVAGRSVYFIILGIGVVVCAIVVWRKALQIRNCHSGLIGEQAIAEQLQPLFADGYKIFHDIPGSGEWNIDHVAVGSAGVFAIETKYRTKRPGKTGGRDNQATFDGKSIQFSSGDYEVHAVDQARNSARWLAQELSQATGERVTAQPIVALPGWWVTLKANSDVKVLSGKQVAGYIAKEPSQLSQAAIQRICYQLEQRCRDVDF